MEFEEPTPLIDQVYLGCLRRGATVDEQTIRTNTESFRRIATSNVEDTHQKKISCNTEQVSSWSYDMKGQSKQCLEQFCELAEKSVSQLKQAETPCINGHQLEKDDVEVVGELPLACAEIVCPEIVLKCVSLAIIGLLYVSWTVSTLARAADSEKQPSKPDVGQRAAVHMQSRLIGLCVFHVARCHRVSFSQRGVTHSSREAGVILPAASQNVRLVSWSKKDCLHRLGFLQSSTTKGSPKRATARCWRRTFSSLRS